MGDFGERIDARTEQQRWKGEAVPGWFKHTEERSEAERAQIEREAQKRVAQGRATTAEALAIAAGSARRIKENIQAETTVAYDNNSRFARAFETFVALGLKGKAAEVKGSGQFAPGWLGTLSEITFATESQDIHEGIDVIVTIPTAEGEIVLGIDVTFSTKRLADKFRKQRESIIRSSEENSTGPLRVIVGVSNAPMRAALMEWGRETDRHEAHQMLALGARIRGQILEQLTALATYAEKAGKSQLAKRYRMASDKLRSKGGASTAGLENDAVHAEIIKLARETASS